MQIKVYSKDRRSYLLIKLNRFDPSIQETDFGITVKIKDNGFGGVNESLGISFDQFSRFVKTLHHCDKERRGKAILSSTGQTEFIMVIEHYDNSGHFTLQYAVGRNLSFNNFKTLNHNVQGEFALDSSDIAEITRLFSDMLIYLERKIEKAKQKKHWLNPHNMECENCKKRLVLLIHSPFYDGYYFYCNRCPKRVYISIYDPVYINLTKDLQYEVYQNKECFFQQLSNIVEERLNTCDCGGQFQLFAQRRCVYCASPIPQAKYYEDIWQEDNLFDENANAEILKLVKADDIWKTAD